MANPYPGGQPFGSGQKGARECGLVAASAVAAPDQG
jgi:hypothetical protein